MDGIWDVYFEDKPVGTCRVWREGLYYRFNCRCDRVTEEICRLLLQCGEKTVDLGVLIPVGSGFGLDRKLSARNMPAGEPQFSVKVLHRQSDGRFIPVRESDSFAFLSALEKARFGKQNGEVGVFLG